MRIVVDLQGAQGEGRKRGIERYSLAFTEALARNAHEHEIVLTLTDLVPETIEPVRARFEDIVPQAQIRVWHAPGPIRSSDQSNSWRRAAAARLRWAFIESLEPDLVHVTDMFGGYDAETVVEIGTSPAPFLTTATLFDLIPLLRPSEYLASSPAIDRHYRNAIVNVRRLDGWLAISEASAEEGRRELGLPPERVANVSAACSADFRQRPVSQVEEQELRARLGIPGRFVMYSGGADSRKNLDRLIQGYATLPADLRTETRLVMAGNVEPKDAENLRAAARHAGLTSDEVCLTGFVPDADLVALYNLCDVFVLPSTHEGFGLPALEAMSCGAAVVGANASSVPEVIQWPEALFDPLDPRAIGGSIRRALTDEAFHAQLVANGITQSQRFSWDAVASRALDAFEALSARSARPAARAVNVMPRLLADLRTLSAEHDDLDLISTARAISQNHPPEDQQPRLVVDVSELVRVDARSGIQRVVKNTLVWLPRLVPQDHEIVLVCATGDRRGYRLARPAAGSSGVERTEEVVDFYPTDTFLALDLQPDVVVAQASHFDALRRQGSRVIFVVYDLLPLLMPQRFASNLVDSHRAWIDVVSSSDAAICISDAVAAELRDWLEHNGPTRLRPFRITSFHLGADLERDAATRGMPEDAPVVFKALEARPSFLMVGTIEPRKGHRQALAAFERLWAAGTDINLVIVGRNGWYMDDFVGRLGTHPEFNRRLLWLQQISDEYLGNIYGRATCLLFASEGEGFGLPLIEAAQRGVPILARDIPVFREVAGGHAEFFSGDGADELAQAVTTWLSRWRAGTHPTSSAMPWMTWQESVRSLVRLVFEE